jgi:hypothetical protein
MAYVPHTLVTISGTLTEVTGQDEIWSIGVRGLNTTGGANEPIAQDQLDDYLAAVNATTPTPGTWFQDINAGFNAAVFLTQIKAVNIGADGKYTGPASVLSQNLPGGVSGSATKPSFLSLAYSWTTARTYGRRLRYGRVYPPNFNYSNSTGSTVTSATQGFAAAAAKNMLGMLKKSGSQFAFTPCVVSSQGGFEPITGIRVGNVWDVQRRRKDRVGETYVAVAFP